MKCSFCDAEFEEADAVKACKSCCVFGGCQKVRCPHCGYESPRETRLVRWIKGFFGRRRHKARSATAPLSLGRAGEEGEVVSFGTHDQPKIQKLMAMGILPGAKIRLLRTFPSFVFQVDYSQFTVDEELAGEVVVRWKGEAVDQLTG